MDNLEAQSKSAGPVQVRDYFLQTMFCLQCAMYFGLLLDKAQIHEVQSINRRLLLGPAKLKFSILNTWPKLTRILFPARWAELHDMRSELDQVYGRLFKARKEVVQNNEQNNQIQFCYVDSLLEVKVPKEEGGETNLTEGEMVSLCNEFLNASTDLPTTTLEWAMANMVKYPQIQAKLVHEIRKVVGPDPNGIREEYLDQMPHLKAVILEVLRHHPPAHIVLPHWVTDDIELGGYGYLVPKNAAINVTVAEIGRDPNVWEDPMEFRPERFLDESDSVHDGKIEKDVVKFDVAGRKEIKMMPFGVGRRKCPGHMLA